MYTRQIVNACLVAGLALTVNAGPIHERALANGPDTGVAPSTSNAMPQGYGYSSVVLIEYQPAVSVSTVYSTSEVTITRCAPDATDCPALSYSVQTSIIAVSTTVCPLTLTSTKAVPQSSPSTLEVTTSVSSGILPPTRSPAVPESSSSVQMLTSYRTATSTVTLSVPPTASMPVIESTSSAPAVSSTPVIESTSSASAASSTPVASSEQSSASVPATSAASISPSATPSSPVTGSSSSAVATPTASVPPSSSQESSSPSVYGPSSTVTTVVTQLTTSVPAATSSAVVSSTAPIESASASTSSTGSSASTPASSSSAGASSTVPSASAPTSTSSAVASSTGPSGSAYASTSSAEASSTGPPASTPAGTSSTETSSTGPIESSPVSASSSANSEAATTSSPSGLSTYGQAPPYGVPTPSSKGTVPGVTTSNVALTITSTIVSQMTVSGEQSTGAASSYEASSSPSSSPTSIENSPTDISESSPAPNPVASVPAYSYATSTPEASSSVPQVDVTGVASNAPVGTGLPGYGVSNNGTYTQPAPQPYLGAASKDKDGGMLCWMVGLLGALLLL